LIPEIEINSWQSYVLTQILRLNYSRISPSGVVNIEKDRRDLDRLGRLFKPLAPIQCTPVMVNNIPAEWITPAGNSTERIMLYLNGGAFVVSDEADK